MRTPWWLWILAALGGALFLWRAPQLWPLVNADVRLSDAEIESRARAMLLPMSVSGDVGQASRANLSMDEGLVDFLEDRFGREEAQKRIGAGAPVVRYSVSFSRTGDPHRIFVDLHPNGSLIAFNRSIEDDDPPPREREITEPEARETLGKLFGISLKDWHNISTARREQPNRIERNFVYERVEENGLRHRAAIGYAGALIVRVVRNDVAPPAYFRSIQGAAQARETLGLVGVGLLGPLLLVGVGVFLLRLRGGTARLRIPGLLAGGAFLLLMLSHLPRFSPSDPMTPDALELARYLVGLTNQYGWTFALLFAVISAGDALDHELRNGSKGATLNALVRGRWRTPSVADASRNGFLIGIVCGGVMAGLVWVLQAFFSGKVALQPRAFNLIIANSVYPPLVTLSYFLQIALLEELGYRYFAATWLESKTKLRWLAILLPGIVYGLTHASLGFLPPTDPFWGRTLVMSVIGIIWGWAFFRFDALTVVLSHLAADLFIFNWPGITRGDIGSILVAASPLLPALTGLFSKVGASKDSPPTC
ncbi:MAG: CPBP family intramembrane metalloprotease [Armatimonas sp.]